jgi:hypothetical protein
MKQNRSKTSFAVCVKNEGYKVSLDLRKIYRVLPDLKASSHGMIRVIDESGEDYVYPADFFVPIEVPMTAKKALSMAA